MDQEFFACDRCGVSSDRPECPAIYMLDAGDEGQAFCASCFRSVVGREPIVTSEDPSDQDFR